LLCGKKCDNFPTQKKHLETNHPLIGNRMNNNRVNQNNKKSNISNAKIKKQVKYIPKLDFIVYHDGTQGEIASKLYNVQINHK
jgi:hypothetical protein